ncbi:hypothetical protein L6452_08965 [Arctium lappa]|uniref:Uncharacterized protein n=1 Tax=Arctium lappa TaxID=4217 RepID=A0ACB9DJU7_ARCLA|nr:hypothetical protein L6452_08965 [Arctium lappa]
MESVTEICVLNYLDVLMRKMLVLSNKDGSIKCYIEKVVLAVGRLLARGIVVVHVVGEHMSFPRFAAYGFWFPYLCPKCYFCIRPLYSFYLKSFVGF